MIEYYNNRCIDKCEKCSYCTCSKDFPSTMCEPRTTLEECEDCYEDGIRIFANNT